MRLTRDFRGRRGQQSQDTSVARKQLPVTLGAANAFSNDPNVSAPLSLHLHNLIHRHHVVV